MNHKETPTTSRERRRAAKENRRQDWGYTDQYRRMMQRDNRKKAEVDREDE